MQGMLHKSLFVILKIISYLCTMGILKIFKHKIKPYQFEIVEADWDDMDFIAEFNDGELDYVVEMEHSRSSGSLDIDSEIEIYLYSIEPPVFLGFPEQE